jgi:hypothetical protein
MVECVWRACVCVEEGAWREQDESDRNGFVYGGGGVVDGSRLV